MAVPPETILRAEGVGRQVRTAEQTLVLLDEVSLSVRAGEAVAVLGPSGSGKSTLLGLLAGLDVPSAGRIWLDGVEITALDEDARAGVRAGRVGFVFQSFQLLPGLTALENVMLPLELTAAPQPRAEAERLLREVGLGHRLQHLPNRLSGGEQQRVAVARAFAGEPRLLFADEPTGNLDPQTGARIIELLFELNGTHRTTLVLVTHDAELAARCGRQLRLEQGRLVDP